MKFSSDQKFLQQVYQMRCIQHQNFMLSRVEHEKTFIIMGPGIPMLSQGLKDFIWSVMCL